MGTAHNPRLQSLRGIAALLVLFGHAALLLSYPLYRPLLVILCRQQNSAVLFFYVLSGYVLGESLRRSFDTAFSIGVALPKMMMRWPSVFSNGPLFGFLIACYVLLNMDHTLWGLSLRGRLLIDAP